MAQLLDGWLAAVARLAGDLPGRAPADDGRTAALRAGAGQDLLARYAEPHRRYHDRRHLSEVLAALDLLAAEAPPAVRCAAWFHDAVYDPAAADNERRSADLATATLPALGVPVPQVDEVARLVLLTAGHRTATGDAPGALLCDADLAVLGASAGRYRQYASQIREEYAAVPDEAFRSGRTAVLQDLLAHPQLYATAAGRQRWERPARRNVTAELDELGGPERPAGPEGPVEPNRPAAPVAGGDGAAPRR